MSSRTERALYESVAQSLRELTSDVDAAESHGMLCGMLCNPEPFDGDAWLRHVLGYAPTQRLSDLPQTIALLAMVASTIRALKEDDFGFDLLLPDDADSLSTRALALGAWCRGFLSGFGLHGAGARLNAEGREFLRDLDKIGQVSALEAQGDDGERAYVEVVEYARVGAMMLHEEFRTLFADSQPSLH
jgi:uncharacterized protein